MCINTDSHFVINSITMWVPGWKRKGWKLANGEPVKNEIDFKALDRLYSDDSMEIKWVGGSGSGDLTFTGKSSIKSISSLPELRQGSQRHAGQRTGG